MELSSTDFKRCVQIKKTGEIKKKKKEKLHKSPSNNVSFNENNKPKSSPPNKLYLRKVTVQSTFPSYISLTPHLFNIF